MNDNAIKEKLDYCKKYNIPFKRLPSKQFGYVFFTDARYFCTYDEKHNVKVIMYNQLGTSFDFFSEKEVKRIIKANWKIVDGCWRYCDGDYESNYDIDSEGNIMYELKKK